jgi:predicted ATPase with chaperone activity
MALMDTDMASKNEYLAKVRMLQTQKEEINKVKSEIADVKGDLQVIKQLMTQLLSKGSNV